MDENGKWERIDKVLNVLLLQAELQRRELRTITHRGASRKPGIDVLGHLRSKNIPEDTTDLFATKSVGHVFIGAVGSSCAVCGQSYADGRTYCGGHGIGGGHTEDCYKAPEETTTTQVHEYMPVNLSQQMKEPDMAVPDPTAQPNLIHKFKNIEHRVRALLNEQQNLTARQAEIQTLLNAIQSEVAAIEHVLDSETVDSYPETTDVKIVTA